MKKVLLFLLKVYQKFISPLLHATLGVEHACRFSPTCSEYARIHIAKDGAFVGLGKSCVRVLYCQPFTRQLPKVLQH